MSPRPEARTDDATARHFLDAAAQLIDAMFFESVDDRPTRLQRIHFPATLQWLRIEDVIALAQSEAGAGVSRKAFHNRWPTKDEFVRDAVIHAMLYRDAPATDPTTQGLQVADVSEIASRSLSTATAVLADALLGALLAHPRSFLLMHVGPVLAQHPDLHTEVVRRLHETRAPWYAGYTALIDQLGVALRPGWTVERLGMAITAMLDGFLLRGRIHGAEMAELGWEDASLFAQTVVAFTLGIIDPGAMETCAKALDAVAAEH